MTLYFDTLHIQQGQQFSLDLTSRIRAHSAQWWILKPLNCTNKELKNQLKIVRKSELPKPEEYQNVSSYTKAKCSSLERIDTSKFVILCDITDEKAQDGKKSFEIIYVEFSI